MRFADRTDAGRQLARALVDTGLRNPAVLALPRGGVPVAAPVAAALGAPLGLVMVRKIGVPGQPELAAGAVVDGDAPETVWNADILAGLGLSETALQAAVTAELAVIEARRARYLQGRAPITVAGRDVIVVDDGIATGATVRAALKGLGRRAPASVTLAVPVAPDTAEAQMAPLVDRYVCLSTPQPFQAVGQGYVRFGQTGDDEVVALMRQAAERIGKGTGT